MLVSDREGTLGWYDTGLGGTEKISMSYSWLLMSNLNARYFPLTSDFQKPHSLTKYLHSLYYTLRSSFQGKIFYNRNIFLLSVKYCAPSPFMYCLWTICEQQRYSMACGAEVYMERVILKKNIYSIIYRRELDSFFFVFPWQLHGSVLQKCYTSLFKKKKHQNVRSFKQMKPNQMHPDASSNSMKVPID